VVPGLQNKVDRYIQFASQPGEIRCFEVHYLRKCLFAGRGDGKISRYLIYLDSRAVFQTASLAVVHACAHANNSWPTGLDLFV